MTFLKKYILPGIVFFSYPAFAVWAVPAHLSEADSRARLFLIKKFIEISGASGNDIFYSDFESSVGKYSPTWGDFNFKANVWVSNQEKFECRNDMVRVTLIDENIIEIDSRDVSERTVCKKE